MFWFFLNFFLVCAYDSMQYLKICIEAEPVIQKQFLLALLNVTDWEGELKTLFPLYFERFQS